jgi:hypothetical protein
VQASDDPAQERPNAPEARQAWLLALLIGYELTGFRQFSAG